MIKRVIGLTGGIGTGKSTVSSFLKEKGFEIIDADIIAREIVEPGNKALRDIEKAFGSEYICADGTLDRKKLGKAVFDSVEKKQLLDSIMIAEIKDEIMKRAQACEGICFVDAPLLFEAGLADMMDEIIVVDAEADIRIRRVCDRDGITAEDVRKRISMQMPSEEKIRLSDIVIDNSGNREELYRQLEELVKRYV